jgi:RNA polymerase sigma-70 factor (ECF subfamily)
MAPLDDFSRRVHDCAGRLAEYGVDGLGALFDLTSHRLVRFAVALTRNQHDAEDAVQTALVRLAREPALLAGVTLPWPYLLQMVRNEALAIGRRRQHLTSAGDLSDLEMSPGVDELEQAEQHRAVWAALRRLPPEQAEVVVLKIWEAMTFAEIGRILSVSPNTAASWYQYAMAKLSQGLLKRQPEAAHD